MSFTDVLIAVLVAAAIWAVVEIALTIRKTRKSIDEVVTSANDAIGELQPIIAKADGIVDDLQPTAKQVTPILAKAEVAVDQANESLARVNDILGDVSTVSGTAADATSAVSSTVAKVAEGAASAGMHIAQRLGGKPQEHPQLEQAAEQDDEPADEGYVTYPTGSQGHDDEPATPAQD